MTRKDIKSLASMISIALGDLVEVSLCDCKQYIVVEKPVDNFKCIGQPIMPKEKYFFEDEEFSKLPFVANYKVIRQDSIEYRASTFFVHDEQTREIQYLLTITINTKNIIPVYKIMRTLAYGGQFNYDKLKSKSEYENISPALSLETLIETVMTEGQNRYGVSAERMTLVEKKSIIREFDTRGVFMIKGAIPLIAKSLCCSDATVYRYLSELKKEEEDM